MIAIVRMCVAFAGQAMEKHLGAIHGNKSSPQAARTPFLARAASVFDASVSDHEENWREMWRKVVKRGMRHWARGTREEKRKLKAAKLKAANEHGPGVRLMPGRDVGPCGDCGLATATVLAANRKRAVRQDAWWWAVVGGGTGAKGCDVGTPAINDSKHVGSANCLSPAPCAEGTGQRHLLVRAFRGCRFAATHGY
jgi:hypothetical protein